MYAYTHIQCTHTHVQWSLSTADSLWDIEKKNVPSKDDCFVHVFVKVFVAETVQSA